MYSFVHYEFNTNRFACFHKNSLLSRMISNGRSSYTSWKKIKKIKCRFSRSCITYDNDLRLKNIKVVDMFH